MYLLIKLINQMNKIPKRFIRIWLGNKPIEDIFEKWWQEFKDIHPDYEFVTITDNTPITIPEHLKDIYKNAKTYAARADILRLVVLYDTGGIYIDTDVMPIKSFEPLTEFTDPFIGLRSKKSFETAVIGSPKGHQAIKDLLEKLPEWYELKKDHACSVLTGPGFVSAYWFGRKDIHHLPRLYFYPFNGFMGPKREEKYFIFSDKKRFPPQMYSAHLSNHIWGGKPKDE